MSQYIYDIVNSAGKNLKKTKLVNGKQEYVIVCDTHLYPYYLAAMLASTVKDDNSTRVSIVYENSSRNEFFELFLEQYFPNKIQRFEKLDEYNDYRKQQELVENMKIVFLFFTNFRNPKYLEIGAVQDRDNLLKKYLEYAANVDNAVFLHVEHIPTIGTLPDGVSGISEREYEAIYADYPDSSQQKALLYLEDVCREYVDRIKIKVLRMDTMFGPYINDDSELIIQEYIKEIIQTQTLTVSADARQNYYSASYIKDALIKTMLVATRGKSGNIYHCSSFHFNLFEVAYDLYTLFDYLKIDLKIIGQTENKLKFHVLNARKMRLIATTKIEKMMNSKLRRAIHVTALSEMQDYEHYITEKIDVYYGKIDRIRKIELELLLEVDKICKENNIKYFLAGGSMLGAVRHNGFIPWDDDMDIGMLPADYKKFVKVCPQSLSDKYSYQTTDLEPESLYIHDKIRIKDTVFCTRYASQFAMENGVYIDIFVYYKTSNNPKKQKWHIQEIAIMRKLLGFRWVNKPRKGRYYYLSRILLPFTSRLSTKFYRHLYIRLLEKYEKKNTDYLIDGTGFNLKKVGAFPKEWFEETVEHEFCGHTFPILKRYDDYLKHWYGEKYMELLPFSERKSVHDVISIDLGNKVLAKTDTDTLRKRDFRGELYEKHI